MSQETEVLQAIYPELVLSGDSTSGDIDIEVAFDAPRTIDFADRLAPCEVLYLPPLHLTFLLPSAYPEATAPILTLRCEWLHQKRLEALTSECLELWQGDEVMYSILDHLYTLAASAFDITAQESGRETIQLDGSLRGSVVTHHKYASRMKFEKQSYECEICLDWKSGEVCVGMPCNHVFCKECLHDMFSLHIKEGSVALIRCPSCPRSTKQDQTSTINNPLQSTVLQAKDALKLVPIDVLQQVVSREELIRYQKLLRKQELESLNSTHCPRTFCATTLARDPDEKLVVCTECEYAFCADCMKGWHGPAEPCRRLLFSSTLGELYVSLCEDGSKVTERQALERLYGVKNLQRLVHDLEDEKLADKWRKENAQGCPVCTTFVEKSMGCNHMICGVCRCHFCFLCGEALSARNPYSHYSDKGLSCYGKLFEGLTGLEDPFGEMLM